jgi:hypothetical protein
MTESINHDHNLPKEEMASSAVYPPMLLLKLENLQGYPQVIGIEASSNSGNTGVTVQDVLRTINEDLRTTRKGNLLNLSGPHLWSVNVLDSYTNISRVAGSLSIKVFIVGRQAVDLFRSMLVGTQQRRPFLCLEDCGHN